MLNLFPTMFLALLAYAILRAFVGASLLYYGYRHLVRDRATLASAWSGRVPLLRGMSVYFLGAVELAAGGMFLAGFVTQAAALAAMLLAILMLVFGRRLAHPSLPQAIYYVMLLGASASLFITGAGALAFDLPL